MDQVMFESVWGYVSFYGLKVVMAGVIFFAGIWLARRIKNLAKNMLKKSNMEETLVSFLGNIIFGLTLAFVGIAALNQLGIETTSLAAVMAAAGLAVGLALQGSLSNFAAGFLVILFRPFKVGDYVEAAGVAGTVTEVSIFTTTFKTPDNKVIIVPNGNITDGNIINYSTESTRRIDLVVGVGYNDDLSKVKKTLEEILKKEKRILKDPSYTVAVSELADSSVNFVVRPWVNSVDYWAVRFDLTEAIKMRFDKEGISIPFPQREVHVVANDVAAPKVAASAAE